MKHKVKPLKARTMTLDELQRETLKFIRLVRRQLKRAAYEPGLNDVEFLQQVAHPLEEKIRQDRKILKMHADREKSSGNAED